MANETLIGVISDTHGLLRPGAVDALRGVRMILHAGDIGKPAVLAELEKIAPVTTIRGNNDRGEWAAEIPETRALIVGDVSIFVLHDVKQLAIDAAASGFGVVIAGHSHKPRAESVGGVLFLNPGSAGPRRFKLPVTVARLRVGGGKASAEIIELSV